MIGYGPLGDMLFVMFAAIVVGRVAAFAVDTYQEVRSK